MAKGFQIQHTGSHRCALHSVKFKSNEAFSCRDIACQVYGKIWLTPPPTPGGTSVDKVGTKDPL